jgi:FkbM family methyltransferase
MESRRVHAAPWWLGLASRVIRSLPRGRYRLSNTLARCGIRPFLARMPEHVGGALFEADLSDQIAREVCLHGTYEPQETALLQGILTPGMTVVDVGANWGYFTLIAARSVGATGRVLSMEPHPALHAQLQRNVLANGMANVTTVRIAAAAGSGALSLTGFEASGGNSGTSRLIAADDASANAFIVDTIDLDSLLGTHGIDTVDLVKIDIEGAEALAIKGMAHGLAGHQYRHVVMEFHPTFLGAHGCSIDDILAAMRNYGYRGWWIDHSPGAIRRAAYANRVEIRDFMRPIAGGEPAGSGGASDAWPHALWVAPGLELPFQVF